MWKALENERRFGTHLKVRRWKYAEAHELTGPVAVHPAIEVAWPEEGAACYQLGSRRLDVAVGQVMVVPAGVEHATSISGHSCLGSIWLGADTVSELSDVLGRKRGGLEAAVAPHSAKVISLGRALQDEAFSDCAGAAIAADALAELIALEVLRAEAPRFRTLPRAPGIRRALERIETDFSETLAIDALAKDAGMSRYHFSRRFREEVGKSPYAYLLDVRLRRAAELLHRGGSTVAEAAFSAGFTDLGRFGRKFKARFGCTPSAYATRRGARIAPRIATTA